MALNTTTVGHLKYFQPARHEIGAAVLEVQSNILDARRARWTSEELQFLEDNHDAEEGETHRARAVRVAGLGETTGLLKNRHEV